MRITWIETLDIRAPLGGMRADSVNHADAWGFATVRIHTEDGLVGTGYTGIPSAAGSDLVLATVRGYYAPLLLGQDSADIAGLWRRLYWSPLHWCGRAGVSHMALAAVDIALWDLAALRANVPLCELLGGSPGPDFPAYDTNSGWLSFTRDELVANVRESIEAGFRGVKIKLGLPDGAEDIARVAAVREAVGDDVELMVDVNQAWSLEHARRFGPALADYAVKWLEEPLDPDDWAAHTELVRAIRTPIALGEHLYTAGAFRDFIQAGAVHFVQADVTRLGGVTEFLQVADLAHAAGLPLCPHAGEMMQVHQHLVFVAPTAHVFEHIPWGRELFIEPAVVRDGRLVRPTAPGAGTAMRDEIVERYLDGRPHETAA